MSKCFVKVFVTVPTAPMTRGVDGVVFENPVQSVLDALGEPSAHGVGVIGDYDNVSFTYAKGRSRYRAIPGSGAHPTSGKIGEIHSEDEAVIAFTAPKDKLDTVIAAIRAHHPYEMPGIDVFELVRFEGDGLAS